MCVAYIFTKLWTGKFFGLLARSSYITTTQDGAYYLHQAAAVIAAVPAVAAVAAVAETGASLGFLLVGVGWCCCCYCHCHTAT